MKKPVKRLLALLPDGAIVDLTGKDEAAGGADVTAQGARDRGARQHRGLPLSDHRPRTSWSRTTGPGCYIPIVPVIGEEVRIGRKTVRRGLVRYAKDPQRMFNYFCIGAGRDGGAAAEGAVHR